MIKTLLNLNFIALSVTMQEWLASMDGAYKYYAQFTDTAY